MVIGVVESQSLHHGLYPELQGARIMITGLEPSHGVDIARAFANHGCRLMLQTPAMTPELEVLLEVLSTTADEVRVATEQISEIEAAMRFAQGAVQAYGGLDAVINLARLSADGIAADASEQEIEDRVADTLRGPLHITRVVANRMGLTWVSGLILNIVTQPPATTAAGAALGTVARATLAALTRVEAENWADKAVRINAVVPAEAMSAAAGGAQHGLASEPEIAALALHLVGKRGRGLSGLLFDAAAIPRGGC